MLAVTFVTVLVPAEAVQVQALRSEGQKYHTEERNRGSITSCFQGADEGNADGDRASRCGRGRGQDFLGGVGPTVKSESRMGNTSWRRASRRGRARKVEPPVFLPFLPYPTRLGGTMLTCSKVKYSYS